MYIALVVIENFLLKVSIWSFFKILICKRLRTVFVQEFSFHLIYKIIFNELKSILIKKKFKAHHL